MKHEIEGSDLRECIDKSFEAGYILGVKRSKEWMHKYLYESSGLDHYFLDKQFDEDIKKYFDKDTKV